MVSNEHLSVSFAASQIQEQTETVTRTQTAKPWNLIVHDDPVTLMNYVSHVFQKVFGYSQQKSDSLMLEVHNTGRCVVWTGSREQAETYLAKLLAFYLKTTMEQSE